MPTVLGDQPFQKERYFFGIKSQKVMTILDLH